MKIKQCDGKWCVREKLTLEKRTERVKWCYDILGSEWGWVSLVGNAPDTQFTFYKMDHAEWFSLAWGNN